MKFFITLSALALVLPALGAPAFTKLAVKKSPTGAKADSYIVCVVNYSIHGTFLIHCRSVSSRRAVTSRLI